MTARWPCPNGCPSDPARFHQGRGEYEGFIRCHACSDSWSLTEYLAFAERAVKMHERTEMVRVGVAPVVTA